MLERLERDAAGLTEAEKKKMDYLKMEIDASIAACLTSDKTRIQDAYNLRNGVKSAKDFSYLWEAYGIEFPAQMRHVPVLRAIFDSLVGKAINRPFKPHVTCVDSDSVNYIFNEYRDSILRDLQQFWINKIKAATMMAQGQQPENIRAQEYLDRIKKKYESGNFKADIEIYAKDMLDWSIQRFKIKSNLVTFMEDLVAAGQCYYQVKVQELGKKPLIRTLNPLNVFYTKNAETKLVKNLDRIVVKDRVPVSVIWTLYGHKMTEDDQEKFLKNFGQYIIDSDLEILDYKFGTVHADMQTYLQKGLEIPLMDISYVEWKANTRVPMIEFEESSVEGDVAEAIANRKTRYKYRLDRFEGTRIGEDIYVDAGKSKFVVRDPDDPSNVDLTINGICYNDRNGEPYSLVLKTKDISDKIDILHYHAENLLAISGTRAIMVNFPDIPAWMGSNPTERIMKWLGYLKQGIGIVDYSQVGNGVGKFSQSSDVDLSMSNAILSIFTMLEHLEGTAYKVTGVPRQAVGEITQNDGKGTSEIALQGSDIVTAPLFACFDEIVEAFLTDIVNACRIAYSEGVQGAIILGEEGQRIFSIKKGQFNLAHMNVHINGDGTEQRDLDSVKEVAMKLVDAGNLQADIAIDMVTIKSLSLLKKRIQASFTNGEANEKQKLVDEIEQYKAELDKLNKAVEKMQAEDTSIKHQELSLRQQEVAGNQELKNKEIDQRAISDAEKLRLDSKRVDLESLQLQYGNSGNKEIRNN